MVKNVAKKKVLNGTKKWPQLIPAKSNNGFGIYKNIFILMLLVKRL